MPEAFNEWILETLGGYSKEVLQFFFISLCLGLLDIQKKGK